jgi:hypothetical protein
MNCEAANSAWRCKEVSTVELIFKCGGLSLSRPVKKNVRNNPGFPDNFGTRSEVCIVSPAYIQSLCADKK